MESPAPTVLSAFTRRPSPRYARLPLANSAPSAPMDTATNRTPVSSITRRAPRQTSSGVFSVSPSSPESSASFGLIRYGAAFTPCRSVSPSASRNTRTSRCSSARIHAASISGGMPAASFPANTTTSPGFARDSSFRYTRESTRLDAGAPDALMSVVTCRSGSTTLMLVRVSAFVRTKSHSMLMSSRQRWI